MDDAGTLGLTTDVQMINVASKGDVHDMADFPYGLAVIVGYLRDQGLETLLLQYPTWKNQEYLGVILENPAYLYGFQVNFENYPDIRNLVGLIKEQNPQAKIIFGGPFVVSLYEELLKNDPDLDAVVLGEGEYTVAELTLKLKEGSPDWKSIRGLAWLDDKGDVIMNPHRPAIADMNAMPFAARDRIPDEAHDVDGNYLLDVRITTSRGCTSNCSFCAVNINSKWQRARQWRGRGHMNVVDEIQELVEKYNVKLINLQDSSFDDPGKLGEKRTRLLCEEILKRGLNISMKAYFRAQAVKDDAEHIELYKLYKEAGVDVLIIGAEAGSDYELDVYQKDASLADNFRGFRVFDDLDLFFAHMGFIMFGPYSTIDTLRQNIRFIWEIGRCYHWRGIDNTLMLTPGAVLYEVMEREGRIFPRENFWDMPAYRFDDQRIVTLAKLYADVREIYPHTAVGENLLISALNIDSRLKNKMNKPVATACATEVEEFRQLLVVSQRTLNDLGYEGFIENLNRVEKDGANAKLVSEPYFGKPWGSVIEALDNGYSALLETIQTRGFGLGGLVFTPEPTAWIKTHSHHFDLDEKVDLPAG